MSKDLFFMSSCLKNLSSCHNLRFQSIIQINGCRIYSAWVEVFCATIHHRLQVWLGNAVEYLLSVNLDSYWFAEVNQLVVEINSQLTTGCHCVATAELQVNTPLLILQSRDIIHVTNLDRDHVLIDIHLVVGAFLGRTNQSCRL